MAQKWNELVGRVRELVGGLADQWGWFGEDMEEHWGWLNVNGKTMLDFGCSSGDSTVWFAEAGAKFILGIDAQPEEIAKARFVAERLRIPAKFAVANALEVELWDQLLRFNWDVVKVDCEGAEGIITRLNKPRVVNTPEWAVETHTRFLTRSLNSFFRDLGYETTIWDLSLGEVSLVYARRGSAVNADGGLGGQNIGQLVRGLQTH